MHERHVEETLEYLGPSENLLEMGKYRETPVSRLTVTIACGLKTDA